MSVLREVSVVLMRTATVLTPMAAICVNVTWGSWTTELSALVSGIFIYTCVLRSTPMFLQILTSVRLLIYVYRTAFAPMLLDHLLVIVFLDIEPMKVQMVPVWVSVSPRTTVSMSPILPIKTLMSAVRELHVTRTPHASMLQDSSPAHAWLVSLEMEHSVQVAVVWEGEGICGNFSSSH